MSLILRQVLEHPLLRGAQPSVLSGQDHLDHVVRWVHSADLYDIAPLLRGNEMLLTNGVGLVGVDETARRLYVRRLAESGVAGLCFEVGRTFSEVPSEMVQEAVEVGLPIVELQPVLRFTEVAEAVNSELIDRSVARLRHADEISRALSEALARGASLSELVDQVAATLGTWARLSDYAGRVVVDAGEPVAKEPSSEAPVLVEGMAWGRLTAGTAGIPTVLIEAVMERAPTVLGLCLIREQNDVAGGLRAQQVLLHHLVANEPADRAVLEARLRAAGISPSGLQYACIAVDPTRAESAAHIVDAIVRLVGSGVFGIIDGVLCGVVAGPADSASANVAHIARNTALAQLRPQSRLCAAVSRTVRVVTELPRAMSETLATLHLGQDLHMNEAVVSTQALALERLLCAHRSPEGTRQFVDDQIGALSRTDAARNSQLVHTLEVLAACGGSKAEAAKRLHIRRQSLYYRLDQISKLLDVDVDDPKQLITLAVAITAERLVYAGR
jgi:PucR family transcriptional regulator, purine catabolism regulatory protein